MYVVERRVLGNKYNIYVNKGYTLLQTFNSFRNKLQIELVWSVKLCLLIMYREVQVQCN